LKEAFDIKLDKNTDYILELEFKEALARLSTKYPPLF
jgi:hypothetical protein